MSSKWQLGCHWATAFFCILSFPFLNDMTDFKTCHHLAFLHHFTPQISTPNTLIQNGFHPFPITEQTVHAHVLFSEIVYPVSIIDAFKIPFLGTNSKEQDARYHRSGTAYTSHRCICTLHLYYFLKSDGGGGGGEERKWAWIGSIACTLYEDRKRCCGTTPGVCHNMNSRRKYDVGVVNVQKWQWRLPFPMQIRILTLRWLYSMAWGGCGETLIVICDDR